jgi:hypothetical protein
LGRFGDRVVRRVGLWSRGGLPADHLLRLVFEKAPDYGAALAMLTETPLATPALFTLVGVEPGQGCVVERGETEAAVRPGPVAMANHFCLLPLDGRAGGIDSVARQTAMERLLRYPPSSLTWLAPPVLNKDTKLVAVADPARGCILAQGFDRSAAATEPLSLLL